MTPHYCDEFPDPDEGEYFGEMQAEAQMDELRATHQQQCHYYFDGVAPSEFRLTCSCGVTVWCEQPEDWDVPVDERWAEHLKSVGLRPARDDCPAAVISGDPWATGPSDSSGGPSHAPF